MGVGVVAQILIGTIRGLRELEGRTHFVVKTHKGPRRHDVKASPPSRGAFFRQHSRRRCLNDTVKVTAGQCGFHSGEPHLVSTKTDPVHLAMLTEPYCGVFRGSQQALSLRRIEHCGGGLRGEQLQSPTQGSIIISATRRVR